MIGLNLFRIRNKILLSSTSRVINNNSSSSSSIYYLNNNNYNNNKRLFCSTTQNESTTTTLDNTINTSTSNIDFKKGFRAQIEQPLQITDVKDITLPNYLLDTHIPIFKELIGLKDTEFINCLSKIIQIKEIQTIYPKLQIFLNRIENNKFEYLLKTYYYFQSLSKKPIGYATDSLFLVQECLKIDQPALAKAFYCLSKTSKTYPQFNLIFEYYLEKKDLVSAGSFFQEFHILYSQILTQPKTLEHLSILNEHMDTKQMILDALDEFPKEITEDILLQMVNNCLRSTTLNPDVLAHLVEAIAEKRTVSSIIYRNVIRRFIVNGDTKNTLKVFSASYSKVNLGYSVFQALYNFLPLGHNPKALSGFINAFLDSMTVIDTYSASIELSVSIIYNQLKSVEQKDINPELAERSITILNNVKEGLRHFPSNYVKQTIYNIITFYLHHDQYDLALQWFSDSLLVYRLSHSIELFSCFLFYHRCRNYEFIDVDPYPLVTIKPSPIERGPWPMSSPKRVVRVPQTPEEEEQKKRELKDKEYHETMFQFWQQHSDTMIPDRKPILKLLEQYQNLDVSVKLRYVENFFDAHLSSIEHLLPKKSLTQLNSTDKELELMLKHNDHSLIIEYLQQKYFSKDTIPQGSLLIESAVLLKSSLSYPRFYDSVPTFVKVLLVNPFVEETTKLSFGDKIMKITPMDNQLRPRNEYLYHMCFIYAINNNMVPLVYDILHSLLYCQIQHWIHPQWKEVFEEWPLPDWKELSTLTYQYTKAFGTNKLFTSLHMSNYHIRIKLESGLYSECLKYIQGLTRGLRDDKTLEYTIRLYKHLYPLGTNEECKNNIKEWEKINYEHYLLDVDLTPKFYQHIIETLLSNKHENRLFIKSYVDIKLNDLVKSINERTLYSLLVHFKEFKNIKMFNKLFIEYTSKRGWPKENPTQLIQKMMELVKDVNQNNFNHHEKEMVFSLISKQSGPFSIEETSTLSKKTKESPQLLKFGIESKIRMILDHNNHFQNEIRLGDNLNVVDK